MPVSSATPPLVVDDQPLRSLGPDVRLDRLAELVSELGEVPMDLAHRAIGLTVETTDRDPLTIVAAALVLLRDSRRRSDTGARLRHRPLVF